MKTTRRIKEVLLYRVILKCIACWDCATKALAGGKALLVTAAVGTVAISGINMTMRIAIKKLIVISNDMRRSFIQLSSGVFLSITCHVHK